MPGWFELMVSNGTQYCFLLKSRDGEIILSSGGYESLSAARNAIGLVQTYCQLDGSYERRTSHNAQFYFVLKDRDNKLIGMSQLYPTAEARDVAINLMKADGKTGITVNIT